MSTLNADDTLFVEERHARIVGYLEERGKATVAELCERFGVSGATMRNDLRALENADLITRAHGGAMKRIRTGLELDSVEKEVQNRDAKRAIARAALELIDDGDTIALDTGTTTLELARLLRSCRDLTVVTNDLAIAIVLEECQGVTTVFLGGTVRKRFHCTVSFGHTDPLLDGLTVDKAFMGTNSFSPEEGASTPDLGTAHTKAGLIRMAAKVILLCDATKHGSRSFARFASTGDIDVLVTDRCGEQLRSALTEHGVEVICAAKGENT
jgi:DeoR family transcriptional regulator, fructose operon transcriptional repressor